MCVVFQYFFFIHFIVAHDVDGETLPWFGWHRLAIQRVYISTVRALDVDGTKFIG